MQPTEVSKQLIEGGMPTAKAPKYPNEVGKPTAKTAKYPNKVAKLLAKVANFTSNPSRDFPGDSSSSGQPAPVQVSQRSGRIGALQTGELGQDGYW